MKKIFLVFLILSAAGINAQWINQNSGTIQNLKGFHFFDSNTGIVYGNNGTLLRTTNGGLNWIPYSAGITDNFSFIRFINDNTGFVLGINNILKTTNKGVNWAVIALASSQGFSSISFFDNSTGYLFGYQCNYSYRTTNCGLNWAQLCVSPPTEGASNYHCSERINDTLILVGGSVTSQHASPGASFFRAGRNSISNGAAYSSGSYIGSIIMAGNSGTGYAYRSGELLKTTDFGSNWSTIPPIWGGMNFYSENLGLFSSKTGNYVRISYSTDKGAQWILKDSIFSYSNINTVKYITPGTVVAVGDSGKILRNSSFSVGINQISAVTPEAFSLSQNIPNPFNPETKIVYSITKASDVSLKVFDATGKEVSTVVSERQSPGTYEAVFDASRLSSGVYFYRLTVDGFSETRKMVVLK